jgi:hypothetical protein
VQLKALGNQKLISEVRHHVLPSLYSWETETNLVASADYDRCETGGMSIYEGRMREGRGDV